MSFLHAAFDPQLVDILVPPIREQTDAVGAGFDGLKVVLYLIQGHVQVNVLPHHVGRLNVECDLGDDAERAQPDNGS